MIVKSKASKYHHTGQAAIVYAAYKKKDGVLYMLGSEYGSFVDQYNAQDYEVVDDTIPVDWVTFEVLGYEVQSFPEWKEPHFFYWLQEGREREEQILLRYKDKYEKEYANILKQLPYGT